MKKQPVKVTRKKLAVHRWNLNSPDYHASISLKWLNNAIRIDIRSFSDSLLGQERRICMKVYVNEELIVYNLRYNQLLKTFRGENPEIMHVDYRIIFKISSRKIELFEEKNRSEWDMKNPFERDLYYNQDTWLPIYENNDIEKWEKSLVPVRKAKLWIRKSFDRDKIPRYPYLRYNLYSANLVLLPLVAADFICHKIVPFYCMQYEKFLNLSCEISDLNGVNRHYCFIGRGADSLTFSDIIRFLRILKYYKDWNDYDKFKDSFSWDQISDYNPNDLHALVADLLSSNMEMD